MIDSNNTHFKKLNLKEKQSKVLLAVKGKSDFVIWKKNEKNKYVASPEDFFKDTLEVVFKDKGLSDLANTDVLYTFSYNGLSFFGKGKLLFVDKKNVLACLDDLYKSERRKNVSCETINKYM